MSKLRVGIVGCGEVSRRAHIPALMANPGVEIVGLCDPDERPIKLIEGRFALPQARAYDELSRMLLDARPDIVHVCTPGFTHARLVAECLDHDVHVLVEKPPVHSVREAEALIRTAQRRNVKVGAILNTRSRDTSLALRRALDTGVLGEIRKIQITHHANLVFSESPAVWNEQLSKFLVYEVGVHLLDLLVHLLGPHEEVAHVLCVRQESIDTTTGLDVLIKFGNGAIAAVDITCDSTRHSSYLTTINVFGTGMDAFVRYFPPYFRLAAGLQHPLEVLSAEIRGTLAVITKILGGRFIRYRNETHSTVINAFVSWVKGEGTFDTALENVLPTVRLLEDIAARVPAYNAVAPIGQ